MWFDCGDCAMCVDVIRMWLIVAMCYDVLWYGMWWKRWYELCWNCVIAMDLCCWGGLCDDSIVEKCYIELAFPLLSTLKRFSYWCWYWNGFHIDIDIEFAFLMILILDWLSYWFWSWNGSHIDMNIGLIFLMMLVLKWFPCGYWYWICVFNDIDIGLAFLLILVLN